MMVYFGRKLLICGNELVYLLEKKKQNNLEMQQNIYFAFQKAK